MAPMKGHGVLGLAGLLVGGGMVAMACLGGFAERPVPMTVAMLVAGAGWALACLGVRASEGWGPKQWLWIGVILLVGRGAAWTSTANLSDDLWRYGWEGALVLEGKSPYAAAPDAPSLAAERVRWAEVYARMNNKSVSAAYPPVTQGYAAIWVALSVGLEGPIEVPQERPVAERLEAGLGWAFGLAELAVLWPLWLLLRRRGLAPAGLLVWAWSPLVMWEFWGAAHFDSLGILCLMLALVGLDAVGQRTREALGGVALGLSIGVKYLPLLLLPLTRRRVWPVVIATLVLVFAPVGLLQGGYRGLTAGLSEYGLRWESWNLGYGFVESGLAALFERDSSWTDPRRLGRLAIGLGLGLVVLWQARSRAGLATRAYWVLGAFLMVSPTLHPWYLAWGLALLPLASSATTRAWLFLIAVSPLLYWPIAGWQLRGEWHVPAWTWPVCALPFWGLWCWGVLADRRRVATEPTER